MKVQIVSDLLVKDSTPCLEIGLLGGFALRYKGATVVAVNTPRLQSLLAYLLLHRDAPQSRHHLAFLLWPESNEAQALTNLRKHLMHLRQALPQVEAFLAIGRHTVQWVPQAPFCLDLLEFNHALAIAESGDNSQMIAALRQAVVRYKGELLPGCYDEWILPEREALHARNFHALERLSQLLEGQRQYPDAIEYSQQLLRHDPLHEATYRRLMRLHALNDDRAAALRTYHTCLTQLREELGVDPDAETQHTFERLLNLQTPRSAEPILVANAPFVGRQAAWQQLQAAWRTALRGQPHFVLIAGEAGIGKTRLAEELLSWAFHQGFDTARARCYAAEGQLTYAPIIDWLRAEPLRSHRSKVAATWRTELARLLPELLQEDPTLPRPEPISQSWQRRHLFEAIARTLLAAKQSLLLLVDDLQWCDQETLECLHFLLRFALGTEQQNSVQPALLIMGTLRSEAILDGHPLLTLLTNLRSSDHLTEIELMPLSAAETAELARSITTEALDANAAAQLYRNTEGNPLFVVEMVRVGLSDQRTVSGNQLAALNRHSLVANTASLPPKIQAVIKSRLAQLSPPARQIATLAAVIGREFTFDVLAAASKYAEHDLVGALDELWQRRIIREQGFQAYDFSHDRIREVAAAEVSGARRRLLHHAVAEALETVNAAALDAIAAPIAAHYEQVGLVKKAVGYWQQAAKVALRIYANHEAIAHSRRALNLIERLPASAERDKLELDLLLVLGAALIVVYVYSPAHVLPVYERATDLAQRLGYPSNPALLRTLGIICLGLRDFERVATWGRQLLELACQEPTQIDPILYVEGAYVLGVTTFWEGKFGQAQYYLTEAINTYKGQHHIHIDLYGQDPGIYCRARLAWTLWCLGYPDQAYHTCEMAIALAQKLAHPFSLQLALTFGARMHVDSRNKQAVLACLTMLQTFREEHQQQNLFAHISMLQGWYFVQCGQIETGIACYRTSIEHLKQLNTDALYAPYIFGLVAEAYRRSGAYDQGLIAVAEAFTLLDEKLIYWDGAELLRIKGELLLAKQDQNLFEIERCFGQALDLAHTQSAKSLELRAAMSLARLWTQQDKKGEAYALLAEIYGWFTEGFDTPDLQEAKALLKRLT